MALNIPGLMAKENQGNNTIVTKKDEFLEMLNSWTSDNNNHYQGPPQRTVFGPSQHTLGNPDWIRNEPYTQTAVEKYTRTSSPPNSYTESLNLEEFVSKYIKPEKSDFEQIINALFTDNEKYEFLLTLGYVSEVGEGAIPCKDLMMRVPRKNMSQEQVLYSSLEYCFLQEITIKFKNLLLSKQALKFKL